MSTQTLTREEVLGQLNVFGVKAKEKAKLKALSSLLSHELKSRLKEREVKLSGKESAAELMSLWVKNQEKKPVPAKEEQAKAKAETKEESPKPEPKEEKKDETPKLTDKEIEDCKAQCDSFGMQDTNDPGCSGIDNSCDKARADLFAACKVYSDQLNAGKQKAAEKKKGKSAGAGTTIFGHQRGAISGKIDDALTSTDGPYTLKEIADLAGTTVARVKNHINTDLKVGLRIGGASVVIEEKDGKFSAKLGEKAEEKKAA